jgi:hypothetical protein
MTTTIEADDELTKVRNDVFQKVGRNIYNFQQIEKLLKLLNAKSAYSGSMSEIEQIAKKKQESINKLNMGTLVGQLFENIYTIPDESEISDKEIKEPYLNFSFKIDADPEFIESRRQALKSLVDERNHLVHHIFAINELLTVEKYREIDKFLDELRDKILIEYEQLEFLSKTLADAMQEHAVFLNSDEAKRQFEKAHLQQSELVQILMEVSLSKARADGWTLLNYAGNELRKHIPEKMSNLKRMYGYKTLKAAMIASELFDLMEEEVSEGVKQLFYKAKPEVLTEYLN